MRPPDNARIVEHWVNLTVSPTKVNSSGRTVIDGDTELTEIDRTEQYRDLVQRFAAEVLLTLRLDNPASFFRGGKILQQSSMNGDGVDALSVISLF